MREILSNAKRFGIEVAIVGIFINSLPTLIKAVDGFSTIFYLFAALLLIIILIDFMWSALSPKTDIKKEKSK